MPRGEFVDQLKSQMDGLFSKELTDLLFHKDFRNHIKGIDIMMKVCDLLLFCVRSISGDSIKTFRI
jgi:hypothetical protein